MDFQITLPTGILTDFVNFVTDLSISTVKSAIERAVANANASSYKEAPKCQNWDKYFGQMTFFDGFPKEIYHYLDKKCSCSKTGPTTGVYKEVGFGYVVEYFWLPPASHASLKNNLQATFSAF